MKRFLGLLLTHQYRTRTNRSQTHQHQIFQNGEQLNSLLTNFLFGLLILFNNKVSYTFIATRSWINF